MWAATLLPFFSNLPSWLLAPLSVLVGISLLSSFSVAVMLLSNRKIEQEQSDDSLKKSTGTELTNTKNSSTGWLAGAYLTRKDSRKVTALMILILCSFVTLAMYSNHQRGYCAPTGDISHSDDFTILYKFSPNCYKIMDKTGRKSDFCVSQTTPTDWTEGTYIEYANYELRNGYADFTVLGASFKKWPSKEAYYARKW